MAQRIALSLSMAMLLSAAAHAQRVDSAAVAVTHRRAVLGDLAVGSRVRVATTAFTSAEGRLAAVRGDTLVVRSDDAEHPVALGDVRMLWVGERETGHGAIVGATTGGVLIGLAGAVLSAGFCDAADCSSAGWDGFLAGAPLGAILGGVLGAGIGALLTGWSRVL